MNPVARSLCVVILLALFAKAAAADFKPEHIRRAKRATGLIVSGRGACTAFCIHPDGFFITSTKYLNLELNQFAIMVLHAGEDDERAVNATLLRTDPARQLALLRVQGIAPSDLQYLEFAIGTDLFETQQVVALGFPFNNEKNTPNVAKYPTVNFNVSRITSLRRHEKKLSEIHLDRRLPAANTGGPVMNEAGQLVGLVSSTSITNDQNVALPVTQLKTFLETPWIDFAPPAILAKDRFKEVDLNVKITDFTQQALQVRLELSSHKDDQRTIACKKSESGYGARTAVIPQDQANKPGQAALELEQGNMNCAVRDQVLELDKDKVRLFNLSQIRRTKSGFLVRDTKGNVKQYKKLGGKPIQAEFGNLQVPVALTTPLSITVYPPPYVEQVSCVVVVSKKDQELARREYTIKITDGVEQQGSNGGEYRTSQLQRYRFPEKSTHPSSTNIKAIEEALGPLVKQNAGLMVSDRRLVALKIGRQCSDEELHVLPRLKDLLVLDLNASTITDGAMPHLAGLKNLRILHMIGRQLQVTDAGLIHIHQLRRLSELWLSGAKITDAGLMHLKGLKNLELLYLADTNVTGGGLVYLKELPKLRTLMLYRTKIRDVDLRYVKEIQSLKTLWLNNTEITDAGLAHLHEMPQLTKVYLDHTHVTPEGVNKLRQALPNCSVRD